MKETEFGMLNMCISQAFATGYLLTFVYLTDISHPLARGISASLFNPMSCVTKLRVIAVDQIMQIRSCSIIC